MTYFVHETSFIAEDVDIGSGTKIWHFSHVLNGSDIGENVSIGQNVVIGPDVKIGSGSKIQNNVSVYKGVTIEEDVFLGPSCVFTNVHTPRAFVSRKSEFGEILVKKGATIGANATIVTPCTLGEYCFIAAGAVVTKNVKPYALMVGVPAKQIGWVSREGEVLGKDLICPRTSEKYEIKDGNLYPL